MNSLPLHHSLFESRRQDRQDKIIATRQGKNSLQASKVKQSSKCCTTVKLAHCVHGTMVTITLWEESENEEMHTCITLTWNLAIKTSVHWTLFYYSWIQFICLCKAKHSKQELNVNKCQLLIVSA